MWERIESDGDGPKMRRMAVPGGWLYAEYYNTQVYPVFVPQPAEQGDKVKPTEDELDEAAQAALHFKWLMPYVSGDDVDLDKDQFLIYVADRINDDLHKGDKVKPSDLASLLDAMEQLITTADSMIYPEETFRNSEYAAADEVITAARRALEAARRWKK